MSQRVTVRRNYIDVIRGPVGAPRFSREELWTIADDARAVKDNDLDGTPGDPWHWVYLCEDLARQCLHDLDVRLGRTRELP